MPEYKTIPVDEETHSWLMELCQAYEMGRRSQGAMVRKLVRAEREKLGKAGVLPNGEEKKLVASTKGEKP